MMFTLAYLFISSQVSRNRRWTKEEEEEALMIRTSDKLLEEGRWWLGRGRAPCMASHAASRGGVYFAVVPGLFLCSQGPLAGIRLTSAQGTGIGNKLVAKLLAFRHRLGGLAAANQDDEGIAERNGGDLAR